MIFCSIDPVHRIIIDSNKCCQADEPQKVYISLQKFELERDYIKLSRMCALLLRV
jgi:hypothetical protein